MGAVPKSRIAGSSASTCRCSMPRSITCSRWSPMRARGWRSLTPRSRGHRAPDAWLQPPDAMRSATWRERGCRRHRAIQCRTAVGCAGDRRGAARRAGGRDRGLRRRRTAGRTAQAVAGAAGRHLSPGIRLFLHGLRDRRRPRCEAGSARPRGDRAGRRRQLPDAELRDRHLGDARREADDRGAGQWRLRLHRSAAARHRRRGVQQPARRLRRAAGGGLPRACGEPWRARGTGRWHRRSGSCAATRPGRRPHQRRGDPHRSARQPPQRAGIGGMSACRKFRRARR